MVSNRFLLQTCQSADEKQVVLTTNNMTIIVIELRAMMKYTAGAFQPAIKLVGVLDKVSSSTVV